MGGVGGSTLGDRVTDLIATICCFFWTCTETRCLGSAADEFVDGRVTGLTEDE